MIQDMHIMLQKEVVDRIVASPGNKKYGRISVMASLFCDTEACFDVSPNSFYPIPKVWSTFLKLKLDCPRLCTCFASICETKQEKV